MLEITFKQLLDEPEVDVEVFDIDGGVIEEDENQDKVKEYGVKKTTYRVPFVPARIYRQFVELKADGALEESGESVEELDRVIGLICDAFSNKFSVDDFYDGVPADQMQEEILRIFHTVIGGNQKKSAGNEPKGNGSAGKPKKTPAKSGKTTTNK